MTNLEISRNPESYKTSYIIIIKLDSNVNQDIRFMVFIIKQFCKFKSKLECDIVSNVANTQHFHLKLKAH